MFRRGRPTSTPPRSTPRRPPSADEPAADRPHGPWDASEVTIDEDDDSCSTSAPAAPPAARASSCGCRSTRPPARSCGRCWPARTAPLELRAFAAPRNGDIWADVRRRSPAEIAQHGGTATESEGAWGTELVVLAHVRAARRHPRPADLQGHRRQRPALAAAGDAVRPSGRGVPRGRRRRDRPARHRRGPRDAPRCPPGDALPLTLPPNAQPRRAGARVAAYAGDMSEVKGRLRKSLSKWASSADMEARELSRTPPRPAAARSTRRPTVSASSCRAACARSPCARAAASPPSRPSCTTAPALITLVWLGRRRIAGIEPGRAIRSGPGRRARRRPGHVQPALRAECRDRSSPTPPPDARPAARSNRRGGGARPAVQGARRQARHARGRRPDAGLHRLSSSTTQRPPARARRQRRRAAVVLLASGWCSARRCSSC